MLYTLLEIDWNGIWNNFLSFLFDLATSLGLKIIYAILIIVIGLKLTKLIIKRIRKSKFYNKTDASAAHFLVNVLNITLKIFVFVSAALVLGVPATTFAALMTSGGVAIGLALQGSLSNLAGGIMIMIFKPFREGDYIEYADVSGTVVDITIFYTILKTPDNKTIHCPNGTLSNDEIINYSQSDTRRVEISVSYSYNTDPEVVRTLLLEIADKHEKVLKDPTPFSRMKECGDSSLTSVLRVWCKNSDYWDVYFDLTEQAKKTLDEHKIEIPYTQMDIHIKQD